MLRIRRRLTLACAIVTAAPAMGLSAAYADVSARGSYQTSITIDVPLFHGITPLIQLAYDSNAGNGPLGMGWSLSVGSQIWRASRFRGVPRFDATDQLWLDDLELVPCASASLSASCLSGGTHSTRVETYRRIRADANANTWVVWRRDGTRLIFTPKLGDPTSPLTTRKWLLTEIVDTHGNRVAYDYVCGAGNSCYISEISYGAGRVCSVGKPTGPDEPSPPVGSQLPGASIRFIWQNRTDPPNDAFGRGIEEMSWRLRAIDVSEGGQRVRVYQINYLPELSGILGYQRNQSWVASIQMFGSDALLDSLGTVIKGTAAPARRFESPSQLYAPAPSFLTTLAGSSAFVPPAQAQSTLPATYNGRIMVRFTDLTRVTVRTYRPGSHFAVDRSNSVNATAGDFDGDRKVDLLQWSVTPTCDRLDTRTLMAARGGTQDGTHTTPQANLCMTMALPADVDDDGRTDVLFVRYKRNDPFDSRNLKYDAEVISARSNGDGTFELRAPQRLWTSDSDTLALQSQCNVGDVNGDRRSDLACTVKESGRWIVRLAISQGYGSFDITSDAQANTLTDRHTATLADANGDGRSDLLVVDERGLPSSRTMDVKLGTSLGRTFLWQTQPTTFAAAASNQKIQVLPGDFNADGRADFAIVLANDNDSGGSITTLASQAGRISQFLTGQQAITGPMPAVSVADVNGDRLDDLVYVVREARSACGSGSTTWDPHVSMTSSMSDGSGRFPIPSQFNGCYEPSLDWPWVGDTMHDPHMVNVNGDNIPDLFQYYRALRETAPGSNVYQDVFILTDRPGEYLADDIWRWRVSDVTGDGRMDWVHMSYANPGLTVLTQVTRADGTRQLVRQSVAPSGNPQTPDLMRADSATTWFLADVGGSTPNAPDGRADIVVVDDVGQVIVTLTAVGDGTWTKTVQPYGFTLLSMLRGHGSAPPGGDVSNWRAMDVNGDGLADLVHVAFRDNAGQQALHVTTVPALGNGVWGAARTGDYTFRGNLRHPGVLDFAPADLNGDGRIDLVRVEREPLLALGQNAIVWSLISSSDGGWEDSYAGVALPTEASGSWRPIEVNGDGKTDLVYVWARPGQPLLVSSMLSLGNGTWQPPQNAAVWPTPIVDTAAMADLRVSDLDGDGKQELVFINKVDSAQLATMVVWNRYPRFIQTTTTGLVHAGSDTLNWQFVDLNADDRPELVRVQVDGAHNLDVVNVPVWERRLTRASNGMGASEEIVYGTVAEADRLMPVGVLPHVVTSVSTRSVDSTAVDASAEYMYTGASYSWAQRRFLGFKRVTRSDGTRILASEFELGDKCGVRAATEELLDDRSRLVSRTKSVFAPTGFTINATFSGTHAFSLCRVDVVTREEWERAAAPRRSEDRLTYDDYGNVIEVIQRGDLADPGDDRRMKLTVNPNTTDFIVDRPAEREVYEAAAVGQWRLLARTRYEYDGLANYALPPRAVGDVTRMRRWNDITNGYVDTSYEYDRQGNLRLVTGPPIPSNAGGVSTTIEYDCELSRFPEKVRDALHVTTAEWDKRLGRVSKSIDANGEPTTFDYDPLGRQIRITSVDGSFERWTWPAANQWNTSAQSVRHERSDGSQRDGVLWDTTFFDGLGRTTRIEREGDIVEEILDYDGLSDRVVEYAAPRFRSEQRAVTTNTYDAAGRLVSSRHPDASRSAIGYQVGSRTVTNELLATTGYDIDAFGRIVAVRENRRDCFAESCPVVETGLTRYTYDGLDRLGSIIDTRRNRTEITWDSLGRMKRTCDPDRGCTELTWNDDGSRASERDANGSVLQVTYDAIGRLVRQVSSNSSGSATRQVQWTWDVDPVLGGPSGASQTRVTRVEDKSRAAVLVSTYHYDKLGRVDRENNCVDRACYELATQFDNAGRIRRIVYPGPGGAIVPTSATVDYVYGDNGMLAAVPKYIAKLAHAASGETTLIAYENGILESRPHDGARGWRDGVHVDKPAPAGPGPRQTLFRQTVLHDYVGRVREESIVDSRGTRRDVYGHDDLGRLTVVTSTDPARNRVFIPDILGNLTSHSQLGTVTYGDPRHVHAPTDTQSGERYTYDALGQMLSSNRLRFVWNDDQRPSEITDQMTGLVSRFAYDRFGIRVKADAGGRVTLTPHPLVEVEPGGTVKLWIAAEGRRIAQLAPKGPFFFHSDALGSTRLVTDSGANVVGEYDYGAWGELTRALNPGASAYQFAGSRSDSQTGLAYMNARYYDPNAAHFVSADPLVPNVYVPQSLNRYAYVLNDPVTLTDRTGYAVDCVPGPDNWGLDCTDRRTPATGQPGPAIDPPADPERDWQREQRAAQREDMRQSRELGPLRPSQLFTPGPSLQQFTPGPGSGASSPTAVATGEPSGNQSYGAQVSGNVAVCLLVCFAVIDVDFGLYMPSDINRGVSPFVTIGGATLLTEAPEDPMTRTDENGNWIPPNKLMLSPGLAAGYGVSGLAFASQTRTFDEFRGYSLNLSGSLAMLSGGQSTNDANQRTTFVGFGASGGLPFSAMMFGSRTYGFTIPLSGRAPIP